jgi:hypothetical protein
MTKPFPYDELEMLYESAEYTDLTITGRDDLGNVVEYRVHKAIVAIFCPKFMEVHRDEITTGRFELHHNANLVDCVRYSRLRAHIHRVLTNVTARQTHLRYRDVLDKRDSPDSLR